MCSTVYGNVQTDAQIYGAMRLAKLGKTNARLVAAAASWKGGLCCL